MATVMPELVARLSFEGQLALRKAKMTEKETLLDVPGMSCASCVHHVGTALKDVDGVSKVDVRLREGKVLVRHDSETSTDSLIHALAEAGYDSSPAAA